MKQPSNASSLTRSRFTLTCACLLSLAVVGSGCLGGGGEKKPAVDPVGEATEVKLLQVEQRMKLGAKNVVKKVNGGQILLVTVSIKNISKADQTYGPEQFKIRKKDSGEPPYEQATESGASKPYEAQFGKGSAEQDLLFPETMIHPNFTAKKTLTFSIPEEDELKNWSLRFVPKDYVMDFDEPKLKVVDNRNEIELDPKELLRLKMQRLRNPQPETSEEPPAGEPAPDAASAPATAH